MNKMLLWLMSAGTGMSAATLYLSQPLLDLLHKQFHASLSETGLIVTLSQLGFSLGILVLIPLGDVFNKKVLIQIKLVSLALMLFLAGISQTITMLFFASFALGIFATTAQDFVPLAADLAPESIRGKVVGTVMSGLLLGILLSRTFSGVTAHYLGWRSVFFICAAAIVLILILTSLLVPTHPPKVQLTYIQLMRSMKSILIENPLLQLCILSHGLLGMIFSSFWTVLTFHLSEAPFHLTTAHIGLFGLAGAAGAIAAPIAGKLSDKRGPLLNIKFGILFIFLSFILMLIVQGSIPVLIFGTILFDLGMQVSFISHQTIIYAMHPEARARINALFMTGIVLCFSIGSFIGTLTFSYYGWTGVIYFSLISCIGSFLLHLLLSGKYKSVFVNKLSA